MSQSRPDEGKLIAGVDYTMPVPSLAEAIENVDTKVRYLLEWMPVCSAGSSGYLRRIAVEKALRDLDHSWALVRL